jgi:protein arginine N-methyltransferase 3
VALLYRRHIRTCIATQANITKDINSHSATPQSLDFHSAFTLLPQPSAPSTPTEIKAFLTHFDTFFSPQPGTAGHVAPGEDVEILPFGDDEFGSEVMPLSTGAGAGAKGEGCQVSFTTGPRGKMTHWKQVVFLLRESVVMRSGTFGPTMW